MIVHIRVARAHALYAKAAAEAECAWSPVLGGVLCLRGYLPERVSELGVLASSSSSSSFSSSSPPAVLLCQGGRDPVAPAEWARAAAAKLRERRRAPAAAEERPMRGKREEEEIGRVQLLVCEDRGHDLAGRCRYPNPMYNIASVLETRHF